MQFDYFTTLRFLLLLCTAAITASCAMQPHYNENGESYVKFGNQQLLSLEQAKALPREIRMQRIEQDMNKIPRRMQRVSPIYDRVNSAIFSIFKNQKALLSQYKIVVDEHKDVMSFIMAHQGKPESELRILANQFDQNVKDAKQKISYKMKRYQDATNKIQQENAKLTAELLVQAAAITIMLKDNFQAMMEHEGMAMLLQLGRLNKALTNMNARLHMAKVANEFIDDEKAVIDITKELQKILETKL